MEPHGQPNLLAPTGLKPPDSRSESRRSGSQASSEENGSNLEYHEDSEVNYDNFVENAREEEERKQFQEKLKENIERRGSLLKEASPELEIKKEDLTDETDDGAGEGKKRKLKYLKYGDKIKIRLSGTNKYYLNSDGFATERVYFQQQSSGEKTSQIFRVMPKTDYQNLEALRNDLKIAIEASKQHKDKNKPKTNIAPVDYLNDIITEVELNNLSYQQLIGTPVHYYMPIQLVHEDTQEYVSISKRVDLSSKDITPHHAETDLKMLIKAGIKSDIMRVYSLKLVPYSSANTHFVFIPCHKFQESGYILEEDYFYFAYADSKLLSKHFHIYFPFNNMKPIPGKSYVSYMYDSLRTSVKFEIVPNKCPDHLFRSMERKIIWLTHIESPLLLCLEKLEKTTEHDENDLAELIETTGEAVSQTFSLGFKRFDPEQPMTSNGLWVIIPKPDDKRKIVLKHLFYDVWLKPLIFENIVRGASQKGIIGNGSVVKIQQADKKEQITIKASLFNTRNEKFGSRSMVSNLEDYSRCFKIVQVKDEEQLKYSCLAQLSIFIRGYDEQTLLKSYDFTKTAVFEMLSKVLSNLRKLCRNTLVATYNPLIPYGVPHEDVQMLFRESKCIDTFTYLLLKLFPAGASGDYKNNPAEAKVLGQLLMLIAITVKNNTKNQVYTFNKAMSIIQKYIGLHLAKKQEDQALLSVVENCEEILLDLSLDQIISQFVRELAINDFGEQMKKHEILNILRIFCIFRKKAITETQNLLHNILFETEKGSKIFLPFKFNDSKEMILRIDGDEEISCTAIWENRELKTNVLTYFRNQLFLLSDICYKNPVILGAIKDMFPIPAVLHNLSLDGLDPIARIGLAKILTTLFENTENLIFVTKPKLQQEWDEDSLSRGRVSKFMNSTELDYVKEMMEVFFTKNFESEETTLHCEYLKFLSYLVRCDFIFSQSESSKDWERKMQNSYRLLYRTFYFCCYYLESITSERKHNATLKRLGEKDDSEELPQILKVVEPKSEDLIKDAPLFMKFSTNYAHIFNTLREAGKKLEDQRKSSGEDSVQQEICNFFVEMTLLIQDVYLSSFKGVFKRTYENNPEKTLEECTTFIRQIFGKFDKEKEVMMREVSDSLKYKTLTELYSQYEIERNPETKEKGGLMGLLVRQLILSNNVELENSILNALIGYQLPKTEFARHLNRLFIIADKRCTEKYKQLSDLMPDMADCLNQLVSWLNVSDVKTLKQSSLYLAKWRAMLVKLYNLFEESEVEQEDNGEIPPIKKKDERFTNLFNMAKAYTLVINFLKLSGKVKIESANNVLHGNEQLGLHAVTFSRELLKVIELSNKVLIVFCKDSLKAKYRMLKHIPKIVLVPPPDPTDEDKIWQAYSELTKSDIALINEITSGNKKMAYLNNQQVRYFKELVVALNDGICKYNIDKVFTIYEVF